MSDEAFSDFVLECKTETLNAIDDDLPTQKNTDISADLRTDSESDCPQTQPLVKGEGIPELISYSEMHDAFDFVVATVRLAEPSLYTRSLVEIRYMAVLSNYLGNISAALSSISCLDKDIPPHILKYLFAAQNDPIDGKSGAKIHYRLALPIEKTLADWLEEVRSERYNLITDKGIGRDCTFDVWVYYDQ